MANRSVPILTDRQARVAKKTIAVGGVKGLILKVRPISDGNFSRTFQLRMSVDGNLKYLSIGPYPETSLEEARRTALEWRNKVKKGENPRLEAIEARKAKSEAKKVEKIYSVQKMMFDYCDFGENRLWQASNIKGQKLSKTHTETVSGWMRVHIPEEVRKMPAKDLTPEILASVFEESWRTLVDTPERVLGEMKRAFDFAIRSGKIPPMQNPADLKGKLRDLLPPDSERPQKGHQPALSPDLIPDLFAELQTHTGIVAKYIQFAILTCNRAANARLVLWSEIFLDPEDHKDAPIQVTKRDEMKVKRVIKFDKETPLSKQVIDLLKTVPRYINISDDRNFVFSKSDGKGGLTPLSTSAAYLFIKKMNANRIKKGLEPFVDDNLVRGGKTPNISLHGTARASFETWAYDSVRYGHKQYSEKAIEHCLDHVTEKYNNAYLRRAVIGEMREILEDWGEFCFSKIKKQE